MQKRPGTFSVVKRDGTIVLSGGGPSIQACKGTVLRNVTMNTLQFEVQPVSRHHEVKREIEEEPLVGTALPPEPKEAEEIVGVGEEEKACTICNDRKRSITFIPCGHFVACYTCTRKLYDSAMPSLLTCPHCTGLVEQAIRTYM